MSQKSSTLNHVTAGFTAVLVGYTSSVVIIMQAASAAGASPNQIESWLLTLGITMGLTSIGYSWFYKTPILTAWSTPGAAILVTSAPQYELPVLIGSFMITGVLIFLTGLISPLSRALQRIPSPLATAMLAAILMPFCLQAFEPVTTMPVMFVAMFTAYIVCRRFAPRYLMLILLIIGLMGALMIDSTLLAATPMALATFDGVIPHFALSAMLNISLPLYIVTMLSQNLPGIAMMKSYHYQTPVKPILIGTGVTNILSAPFGGFSINLAAISAALCMNETVDSNKNARYRAVLWAGGFYLIAGMLASSVVAIFLSFPTEVTKMLAGFALLGTLMMCLHTAFQTEKFREAALLTFLVTLSGVTIFGINSTLWGLIVGWLYYAVMDSKKSK
ncbi:benzoate/H(+) symporter BenE family transporter [Vibrio sp. RE88]|uniref:benzoate/H(+) symporter BenE family transporter n=1 Tax=Vibrio sp. RE88 TaxID=2607610 RepID=UPI001493B9CE|nr:benzoate/H(+) symporter BenE family transporter [Vibrio sp. RE88]NOH63203.1 benzoate/H(+) symporter BenE family transporter [Vibrio sp. RE88]